METIFIDKWDDYVHIVRELDGWAFRGQQRTEWPLYSSLSRHLLSFVPDTSLWRSREERAIRIFRRKAHNYISDARSLDDELRCLAMIQHHGGPTRLLDFTKSPFVAAFFALEAASGDSAVFAVDTPSLWTLAPISENGLVRSTVDPKVKGNLDQYFFSGDHSFVWAGEPNQMDLRLVAQSGTFVIPSVLDKTVDEILAGYPSGGSLIKKIVLSAGLRQEGLSMLYRMNVTHASLFPDLEGLARSTRLELEVVWNVS
ncbi:FRG domain-containing protein [Aquabacterium sp. A7-Y]|uniref:FRG domain-containing protein n=1 Tax=Aquabacterium sp. A7-Y TaxID=1349605 RepID=UPI00223DB710|nr:FRG domain-containing protein [Aquabacterium sp. A7-Y]MCW7539449.1 FRG domain-containing protein [Aquabacterium sp. A7-Y]